MNTRFVHQDNQDSDFDFEFNSFKGTYIGDDLLSYLNIIDPTQNIFQFVPGYINAFPESKCFFEHFFPFYMGTHVTQDELVSFYEENYCDFVEFFKMNHPDWSEYTNAECLQHFVDLFDIYANGNDVIYYSNISHRMNQNTPQTLEKPHFSAYNPENNEFLGFGYFPNVSGDTTAWNRQIGEYGPYGYSGVRFNLENHLRELESRNSAEVGVEFYLERGNGNVKFDFDRTGGSRYTCSNFALPERFLFENSFQREKEEIKEAQKKQRRHRELIQFQEYRRRERVLRENNPLTVDDWIRNTSIGFIPDTPSMIEIQAIFASQPLLPFQYRGLPIPRVNPTDYREPLRDYNEEYDNDSE